MDPKKLLTGNDVELVDQAQGIFLSSLRDEHVSWISTVLCSMDPWRTLEYTPDIFEYYFFRADLALTRYEIIFSGTVVGILTLRSPWLSGPFIELMALFEGFQGKGIGRRLIDWICDNYKSFNLWATVSSFNLKAQKFYSDAGFQQMAILDDLIKEGWDEILLRKRMAVPGRA
jgi:GNAT superfamily N-acetyltransferase